MNASSLKRIYAQGMRTVFRKYECARGSCKNRKIDRRLDAQGNGHCEREQQQHYSAKQCCDPGACPGLTHGPYGSIVAVTSSCIWCFDATSSEEKTTVGLFSFRITKDLH